MSKVERELRILEALEANPEVTQAGLATQLGVAVGSVNWYLKRLIRKGCVKVTHLQRRRLKYFLTPKGLALKGRLTVQYMKASLRVYRELRRAAAEVLDRLRRAGYRELYPAGRSEAMEIFRLTCLEMGMRVVRNSSPSLPTVRTEGMRFVVEWPGSLPSYLIYLPAHFDRDAVLREMAARGISCRHGIAPMHLEPYYLRLYGRLHLPITEEVSRRTMFLPIYPQMSVEEQQYVVDNLREIVSRMA